MHRDAIEKGQKVLIVDDLLATGGTARATVDLVRQLGGDVHGISFLIELVGLEGRSKLLGENVRAVLQVPSPVVTASVYQFMWRARQVSNLRPPV